ncbi:uracil-DNA glycosylase family protein [Lutimonas sp.]|uniref:uracil-DNA glycosylase family protein n=1 Tax=Lutimonas sp. TaxID=1872403 RepID=UPI003D9BB20D
MENLLGDIRNCTICLPHLVHGVNPVLTAHRKSKVAIVGQAPGSVVHNSGIPWDDKSGERLRQWLGLHVTDFYNEEKLALIPMGFCYPGKGKSGDLPPRKECAPQWHQTLFSEMNELQLVVLIGTYAQSYYLGDKRKKTLTETVRNYTEYLPKYFPLPHPSPRNNIWLRKNDWFENEVIPVLRQRIGQVLLP